MIRCAILSCLITIAASAGNLAELGVTSVDVEYSWDIGLSAKKDLQGQQRIDLKWGEDKISVPQVALRDLFCNLGKMKCRVTWDNDDEVSVVEIHTEYGDPFDDEGFGAVVFRFKKKRFQGRSRTHFQKGKQNKGIDYEMDRIGNERRVGTTRIIPMVEQE